MIVGLVGIKLKSMSVRSWRWTLIRLPRNPHIAVRVLLKRANPTFVLAPIPFGNTNACLNFNELLNMGNPQHQCRHTGFPAKITRSTKNSIDVQKIN